MIIAQNDLKDTTLWTLLAVNLISLCFALLFEWSLFEMVWVYLSQNIAIGFTNFLRMRALEKKNVNHEKQKNLKLSNFFAMHYGLFHIGYILFLIFLSTSNVKDTGLANTSFFIILIISFIAAHIFSFKQNNKREFKKKTARLSILLFYPYVRTIPMHVIVIASFFVESTAGIILFMTLKTLGDSVMHIIEHKVFRNR